MYPISRDAFPAYRAVALAVALVGATALLCAADANAGHLGLDGSSVTLGDGFEEDLNPRGGRLRLGARLVGPFDVELHAGLSRDGGKAPSERFDVGWAGAYLKAHLPIGSRSALYALGGVAGVRIGRGAGEVEFEEERGGFSYGVGLETELTERLDLSADWMRYLDDEGAFERIDAVSLGLKLYF